MDPETPALPAASASEQELEAGLAVLVGTLGAVPVVGPLLGSLATTYLPDVKFNRLTRFATGLAEEVAQLADRVDTEFVHRAEFAPLFEDIMDRTQRARNDQKLAAFAAFTARCMTRERPGDRERERYLNLLDLLTPAQMRVLGAIATGGSVRISPQTIVLGAAAAEALGALLADVDCDPYLDVEDLTRLGLVQSWRDDTSVLMHVAQGHFEGLLTPLGTAFVRFVSAEALARSGPPR